MSKLADYSQVVTADQLDAALRAGGFDGVFHYIRGTPGWVLRIEDPAVVAGIRQKGWPQLGIDVPLNPSDADGAAMAAAARAYGYPAGSLMALDVEPSRFTLDPAGWARAGDAWCDGVRAGGYSPGPYGNDDTVAACGSRADWIWRAKPGQCDPAGPGLADAFFAGRRVVQCSSGVWGGIEFDVSFSQFAGGPMATTGLDSTDPVVAKLLEAAGGFLYLFKPPTGQDGPQAEMTLRIRAMNGESDQLVQLLQTQGTTLAAVKTELDAIQAAIGNLTTLGGWTPAQQAEVDALKAASDRIEAAFKNA